MDPVLVIVIFLGVLVIMGATVLALLAVVKAQLDSLIANTIGPADATAIQTAVQGLSDTLTGAGSPPPPTS